MLKIQNGFPERVWPSGLELKDPRAIGFCGSQADLELTQSCFYAHGGKLVLPVRGSFVEFGLGSQVYVFSRQIDCKVAQQASVVL